MLDPVVVSLRQTLCRSGLIGAGFITDSNIPASLETLDILAAQTPVISLK
ncbi:hypothetical protein ACFQAT_18350 [Undibacterium arcticum]|uniref:Uncharacterized protein n=1 Tax=Undibacterium arcticum TaxID=1762892 RepID=A0ABV7F7N7_9BURK